MVGDIVVSLFIFVCHCRLRVSEITPTWWVAPNYSLLFRSLWERQIWKHMTRISFNQLNVQLVRRQARCIFFSYSFHHIFFLPGCVLLLPAVHAQCTTEAVVSCTKAVNSINAGDVSMTMYTEEQLTRVCL